MNSPLRLALAGALLCCSVAAAQPSIVIADDAIVVAGKPLSITVKQFLSLESPELVEALVARRALAPDENPCGQIQAPGSSPFALIRKVLFACTTAGLTSIGLREKSEQPVASVTTVANAQAPVVRVTTGPMQAIPAGKTAITLQVEDAVPFASLLEVLESCGLSQVTLTSAEPTELLIQGSLDKELVRKVVLKNQAQVRACYDRVLAGFPKLDGKTVLKFAISANGTVSSSVAESTSNTELSNCISERVKTWVFPRPRGGGAVVVTYPFTFTLK